MIELIKPVARGEEAVKYVLEVKERPLLAHSACAFPAGRTVIPLATVDRFCLVVSWTMGKGEIMRASLHGSLDDAGDITGPAYDVSKLASLHAWSTDFGRFSRIGNIVARFDNEVFMSKFCLVLEKRFPRGVPNSVTVRQTTSNYLPQGTLVLP